jgi:hypothetical protein
VERPGPTDFSLAALYAALDARRLGRGLSWRDAVREMSDPFSDAGSRALSPSTVTSLRTKAVAEGDGVLQMLRWLGRSPESFIPGSPNQAPLPPVPPRRVLRLDTRKLYDAVNARRSSLGLTWGLTAASIPGVTESTLMHLAKGGRSGFPHVTRITAWLGVPLAEFVRWTVR